MKPERTEPIPMKAGDKRVMVNGEPVQVDFRIISEELYQELSQSSPVESKREEELERVIRKAYKWLKEPHVPIGSVITLLRKAIERSELPIEETKEK